MPTISTIYDKPGAGWNRINTDNYFKNYFKTNEMGDVVQQEKKSSKCCLSSFKVSFIQYKHKNGSVTLMRY